MAELTEDDQGTDGHPDLSGTDSEPEDIPEPEATGSSSLNLYRSRMKQCW